MRSIALTVLLVMLFLGAVPGHAQDPGDIFLKSEILREVQVENEKGEKEKRLVVVEKAFPGEELIFSIFYTNNGTEPAENIIITNPVPEHMVYVGDSASGDLTRITFSVDGGESFDLPENLVVKGEDGKVRPASSREYTHIRWIRAIALEPGGSGKTLFRAILK